MRRTTRGADTGFMIRVPHSAACSKGTTPSTRCSPRTIIAATGPRSWLINGIKKIETLHFLEHAGPHARPSRDPVAARRTARDDACCRTSTIASSCANSPAAPDAPPLTARRAGAHRRARTQTNFGIEEEPMKYKGTMTPPDAAGRGRACMTHAHRSPPTRRRRSARTAKRSASTAIVFCSGQIALDPRDRQTRRRRRRARKPNACSHNLGAVLAPPAEPSPTSSRRRSSSST